jgi:hypothetical protein
MSSRRGVLLSDRPRPAGWYPRGLRDALRAARRVRQLRRRVRELHRGHRGATLGAGRDPWQPRRAAVPPQRHARTGVAAVSWRVGRRQFLLGSGAAGALGVAGLAGACGSNGDDNDNDDQASAWPFRGAHQAGVTAPPARAGMAVALDARRWLPARAHGHSRTPTQSARDRRGGRLWGLPLRRSLRSGRPSPARAASDAEVRERLPRPPRAKPRRPLARRRRGLTRRRRPCAPSGSTSGPR